MRIVEPSWAIEDATPEAIERIERVARTCYRSEGRAGPGTATKLVRMLRRRRHFPMFDHVYASVRIVCSRAISHEIVRHRIGVGYAQESQRFVGYANEDKHPDGVAFVLPMFFREGPRYLRWKRAMESAEESYMGFIADGASPQEAREVLPNSTRTEIVITGTFTFWRHFFELRTADAAHPEMRRIIKPLLAEFIERWPEAFDDIGKPSLLERGALLIAMIMGYVPESKLRDDLEAWLDEAA
jgi:thymidylate synthase (FAD)